MFKQLFAYAHNRYRVAYDRERYENILRDPNSRIGKFLNFLIQVLIVVSVGAIIFESIPEVKTLFYFDFIILDVTISLVFATEYIYRFFRSKKKTEFVLRPLNIIDLLSFAPFFIGFLFPSVAGLDILKVLRLLRILRLFEISSQSPIALGFFRTLKEYQKEYTAILMIFLSVLIIVSTLVYYFER